MLNRRVHRAHSRPMFDRLTRFVATLVPRLKHDKQKRNYTTIIPVLRQRTDTPGSAPVDFLRKNAIFLSKLHSWQGSESLLSRLSRVRVAAGAPNFLGNLTLSRVRPVLPLLKKRSVVQSVVSGSSATRQSPGSNKRGVP